MTGDLKSTKNQAQEGSSLKWLYNISGNRHYLSEVGGVQYGAAQKPESSALSDDSFARIVREKDLWGVYKPV